jgi:Protein of unknown function (DUF3103)
MKKNLHFKRRFHALVSKILRPFSVMVISFVLVFLSVVGCENETLRTGNDESGYVNGSPRIAATDIPQLNEQLEEIAKGMALYVSTSKQFKQYILKRAAMRFDGDYDVLFASVSKVKDKTATIEELLAANIAKATRKEAKSTLQELRQFSSKLPLFHIAVPVNIDKWGADIDPLVVVMPLDFDESTHPTINAYDKDGKLVVLDAKNPPEKAVIVLGMNERTYFEGGKYWFKKDKKEVAVTPPDFTIMIDCDGYDICDPNSCVYDYCACNNCPPTQPTCPLSQNCTAPYLPNNVYVRACSAYMGQDLLGTVEGWPAGAPELDLTCFSGNKDTGWTTTKILGGGLDNSEPGRREDIRNKWWNIPNTPSLYNWNVADVGDLVLYSWSEDDWEMKWVPKSVDVEIEFKPTVFGIELGSWKLKPKWEIGSFDEKIGSYLVDQKICPPAQSKFNMAKCYNINNRDGFFFTLRSYN